MTRPPGRLDIAISKAARKQRIPDFIQPCLATAFPKPPTGDKWIHEVKFDGYRLLALLHQGKVMLKTRGGGMLDKAIRKCYIQALKHESELSQFDVPHATIECQAFTRNGGGVTMSISARDGGDFTEDIYVR